MNPTQWVLLGFGFGVKPRFFNKMHLDGFWAFYGFLLSTSNKYPKMYKFIGLKVLKT